MLAKDHLRDYGPRPSIPDGEAPIAFQSSFDDHVIGCKQTGSDAASIAALIGADPDSFSHPGPPKPITLPCSV